jgi:hypothetical protein
LTATTRNAEGSVEFGIERLEELLTDMIGEHVVEHLEEKITGSRNNGK